MRGESVGQERSFTRGDRFNDASQRGGAHPLGRFVCALQSPAMANLTSVLKQFQQERNRLASQLEPLNDAISALNVKGSSRRGKISSAGRARIAAAQRARWAKVKGRKVFLWSCHLLRDGQVRQQLSQRC
jgi:hypothetical protein